MCVCVEDWSREKLNKLNIKEVFVNGITRSEERRVGKECVP